MVKVSAPGNIFFLGEHAVAYGYPSINASVDRRTFVEITERRDDRINMKSEALGEASAINESGLKGDKCWKPELSPVMDMIGYGIGEFGIKTGFDVKITSQIPVESGMSSSTAVLSALLKALAEVGGRKIKNEAFYDHIYPFQAIIHGGKASGSEIISSAFGGFNRIQKKEDKINWIELGTHEFHVVIGNTKVHAPTALTVGNHIPSLLKREKELVDTSFAKIGKLVSISKKVIRDEDVEILGEIMNKNQKILSRLMLSHPKLDDCISEAISAGALGAKLSGSGWGGIMFALCKEKDVERVARAIESTGSEAIITELGCEGVRFED